MRRLSTVVGLLLVVTGCAKGTGATAGAADPGGAAGGTPDSLFPQSTEDSAGAGADDGGAAFVRRAFGGRAADVVKASCAANKLRLTLDGVLFDFDRDTLQPGADDVLSQIKKAAFDAYPTAHVTVEGHTDSVGTDAHNDDLSARRAKTVMSWFQAHGVDAARLASKGFGKRWPRWPNDTEANRAKNRRVELVVLDSTAADACNSKLAAVKGPGSGALVAGPPGSSPAPTGAGHGSGAGSTGQPELHPLEPAAFSYQWSDRADVRAHTCFTTDPAWSRPGAVVKGYPKDDPLGYRDGAFVDHCPTEGLVATCDQRAYVPAIYSYYRGVPEALILIAERNCAAGKWTRLIAAAPVPKIQPDTASYAAVCNIPALVKCMEARPSATPNHVAYVKAGCAIPTPGGGYTMPPEPPRCPTLGATGRCETAEGIVTYYYSPNPVAFRFLCAGAGMVWSEP